MFGAILGDIIGSPFEFDRGDKTKDFELFGEKATFTDDSVMTIAVGQALLAAGPDASVETIEHEIVECMQMWGREFPNAGYGGNFRCWLREKHPEPYGSYGNGSAMRVSAAGWLYQDLERTREVARATASVTHNHPEGIKGAEATASCIFLARMGASKEDIKEYITREFDYDLNRKLSRIRPGYRHNESCQKTVPEAIIAFLESDGFEDAIRNAVSLGGDTDTLAAITGSIAEAFYGIPMLLIEECRGYISDEMIEVLDEFDDVLGRVTDESLGENDANDVIDIAIRQLYLQNDKTDLDFVLTMILARMTQDGMCYVPFYTEGEDYISGLEIYEMKREDIHTLAHDVRLRKATVHREGKEGIEEYYCIFTNVENQRMRPSGNITIDLPLADIMKEAYENESIAGIVINPFGQYFTMDKMMLGFVLEQYENHWKNA